jgi:G patch domain-containing protein 1
VAIADQIVTDENGRRRFHGAFTGGFSAGYWNTVGSKEGWTPSTFKSTRANRFATKSQHAQDFMDEEVWK